MGKLVDKMKGSANEAIGEAKQHNSNPETRADGSVQELKGKAQCPSSEHLALMAA